MAGRFTSTRFDADNGDGVGGVIFVTHGIKKMDGGQKYIVIPNLKLKFMNIYKL